MREIKFRGYVIEELIGTQWVTDGFGVGKTEYTDGTNSVYLSTPYGEYIVDEKSVGQYTGLKDIKGKEIYEGDIVKVTIKYYTDCSKEKLDRKKVTIEIVSFDYYTFGLKEAKDDESITPLLWLVSLEAKLEVIGNIYENPEL
ncbi:YopX family protein [Clostridium haemolyticum]|uniref:YopX family protein n=1 Tax=Clostridium haemolyticum TaxID=84025 RepID=UPI000652857F|nr:YopX family protein [Clostridium haemolyticum]